MGVYVLGRGLCVGGNWSQEDPGTETGSIDYLSLVTGGIHSVCVCMYLCVHTSEAACACSWNGSVALGAHVSL